MDSSVHGILQVRIQEWVAISSSRGSSAPRDPTQFPASSVLAGGFFTIKPPLSSVQSLSRVPLFVTPWTAACQAYLSITNTWSLLRLTSIASVMPSNHLSLLSFHSSSTFNLSQYQGVFKWVSILHHVAKVLEFQLQHQSFQCTDLGRISFRMDWLDLLAVQGMLKSLLQYHSSKSSILWPSAFFIVQLSHPYMTTGKTIALTRQTFVGKVIFLL